MPIKVIITTKTCDYIGQTRRQTFNKLTPVRRFAKHRRHKKYICVPQGNKAY